MNARVRVMATCAVVGAIGGAVRASWRQRPDELPWLQQAIAGAVLGFVAGIFVADSV